MAPLWYRRSGRALKMYPVHIDTKKHEFRISAPIYYDPGKRPEEQEQEIADKLAKGLRGE